MNSNMSSESNRPKEAQHSTESAATPRTIIVSHDPRVRDQYAGVPNVEFVITPMEEALPPAEPSSASERMANLHEWLGKENFNTTYAEFYTNLEELMKRDSPEELWRLPELIPHYMSLFARLPKDLRGKQNISAFVDMNMFADDVQSKARELGIEPIENLLVAVLNTDLDLVFAETEEDSHLVVVSTSQLIFMRTFAILVVQVLPTLNLGEMDAIDFREESVRARFKSKTKDDYIVYKLIFNLLAEFLYDQDLTHHLHLRRELSNDATKLLIGSCVLFFVAHEISHLYYNMNLITDGVKNSCHWSVTESFCGPYQEVAQREFFADNIAFQVMMKQFEKKEAHAYLGIAFSLIVLYIIEDFRGTKGSVDHPSVMDRMRHIDKLVEAAFPGDTESVWYDGAVLGKLMNHIWAWFQPCLMGVTSTDPTDPKIDAYFMSLCTWLQ